MIAAGLAAAAPDAAWAARVEEEDEVRSFDGDPKSFDFHRFSQFTGQKSWKINEDHLCLDRCTNCSAGLRPPHLGSPGAASLRGLLGALQRLASGLPAGGAHRRELQGRRDVEINLMEHELKGT